MIVTTHFSRLVVLQSLPGGDLKTGRLLRDDVQALDAFYERRLPVDFATADTSEKFWAALGQVLQAAIGKAEWPILHIECHGASDRKGIVLADGTYIPWRQLKPTLIDINVATRCHLLVVLAACHGAYIGEIILPTDQAPCWGLLGPTEAVASGDLLRSYSSFYAELLKSQDGSKSLAALRDSDKHAAQYRLITAEGFFKLAYANYLATYSTQKGYWDRAKAMRPKLRGHRAAARLSTQDLQLLLRKTERGSFDKYYRGFFMIDLFPENQSRFSVTYDEVIKDARALTRRST